MFNFLMTNSDVFDKLYQEINRQNTFYFWIIGIVVAIAIGITVFFGVLEWRLSSKQIENIKSEVLQQVSDTYKSRIERLEETIKEHKRYKNDRALQLASSLNDKFFELTTAKDIGQQSIKQNDIVLTIESIVNNDMVDEKMKVFAMEFVKINIYNCKQNGFKEAVDPIYKRIMDSEKLKLYYEANQQLFNSSMDSAYDKK